MGAVGLSLHPRQMEVFKSKARFRVVVAGRRWGKCLSAGTMISMGDGTQKRVELIRPGDLVQTINEDTYALEIKPVQHLLDNGVKETLVITTKSGKRLSVTPNHPLLANNVWTEAQHLKVGDLVAVPKTADHKYGYLPVSCGDFGKHLKPQFVSQSEHAKLWLEMKIWGLLSPDRISTTSYEKLRRYSDGFFDPIADGDFAWDEIAFIESGGEHQTYDMSIGDNHNFIANGIVTHNTQLSKVLMITRAKMPKRKIWYVAPTYRMAKQIMWSDLLDAIPKQWIKKINETTLAITLVNNSKIELKGADKADSLRGVGLHFLVLDEFQDMAAETWTQVLRPTLADTGGDAIFIGTPKSYNHLYKLYSHGQNPKQISSKQWESWQFPTITSPFIPVAEIEAARADMDAKSFAQEFEASFETMSGRVYYAFDRKKHIGNFPFNPNLPIWVGMDFNIDPMSAVIFQPQPNGELWAVDEIVLFGSNTEEVCKELDRKYWRQQHQITIYPDPAGGQRQHARGETDLDILRENGFKKIKYRRKHPAIADRVNAVNRLLCAADGTVRMRVDLKCKHIINSLEQTIYKPGSRDVDKDAGIEHSADAAGYCIELEYPVRKVEIGGLSL